MLNRKHLIVYSAFVIDPLIIQSYNPLVSVFKTAFNVNVELIALSLFIYGSRFSKLATIITSESNTQERSTDNWKVSRFDHCQQHFESFQSF